MPTEAPDLITGTNQGELIDMNLEIRSVRFDENIAVKEILADPIDWESSIKLEVGPMNDVVCSIGDSMEKVRVIFDTGAIKTLMSSDTVAESSHLSELTKEETKPLTFVAGNDGELHSNYIIRVKITSPQGVQLSVPVHVASNMTRDLILIGNDVMRQLGAVVDVGLRQVLIHRPVYPIVAMNDCAMGKGDRCVVLCID